MNDPMPVTEEDREQIRDFLRAQNFEHCIEAARRLLHRDPKDWETLYALAVAHRYAGQLDAAHDAISRLLDINPEYGRAYQEAGHIAKARHSLTDAIEAYRRATAANPALLASWRNLADLASQAGLTDLSKAAAQQVVWLTSLSPILQSVESFIHEGKLKKAEELCRSVLQVEPTNVEAMRQLAAIALNMNMLADADYLLESAHAFRPNDLRIAADYIGTLLQRQKYGIALEKAEALLRGNPSNAVFLTLVGNARLGVGDFDGAIAAYDAVLADWPKTPTVHLSRGHALKTMGRQADAIKAYRAAYHAQPGFGDAFWSLANLKTYRFSAEELDEMKGLVGSTRIGLTDRIHLHFALGKALEDDGRFAEAFAHYDRGNAGSLKRSGYNADHFDQESDRIIAHCDTALFANAKGGCGAPDPIFIVGMPRAGSTLVEQILASHSLVEGTAELPNILAIVQQLSVAGAQDNGHRYPDVLGQIDHAQFTALGQSYIDETRIHRTDRPRFIDKMPNNFRHVGLIRRMLPNAKIIDVRRDPMACCFSNFKQLFAAGQEFSYDLSNVGRYYAKYVLLMEHWDKVTPGFVLRVRYEDLLDDFEAEVRRILEFCNLPFEPQCLDFHLTMRPVRTASSEQVRQPLSNAGREQWKNFEQFLGPLKDALKRVGAGVA